MDGNKFRRMVDTFIAYALVYLLQGAIVIFFITLFVLAIKTLLKVLGGIV